MIRRWKAAMGLFVLVLAALVSGCSQEGEKSEDQVLSNEYITIKKYEGLTVEPVDQYTGDVEEALNARIKAELENTASMQDVDREIQDGDYVEIDYTGNIDGKSKTVVSGKKETIEMGKGMMVPANGKYKGLEEQLLGHKKGETVTAKVCYDKASGNTELAGKVVVFHIKINRIRSRVIPEFTDEWVKENNADCATMDEYRKLIREQYQNENETFKNQVLGAQCRLALMKQIKVKQYPEGAVDKEYDDLMNEYKTVAKHEKLSLKEYIKKFFGTTEEKFIKQVYKTAQENVVMWQACTLIADKHGLKVDDNEYAERLDKLCKEYELDKEELENSYEKERLKKEFLKEMVGELLAETCVQSEDADELSADDNASGAAAESPGGAESGEE